MPCCWTQRACLPSVAGVALHGPARLCWHLAAYWRLTFSIIPPPDTGREGAASSESGNTNQTAGPHRDSHPVPSRRSAGDPAQVIQPMNSTVCCPHGDGGVNDGTVPRAKTDPGGCISPPPHTENIVAPVHNAGLGRTAGLCVYMPPGHSFDIALQYHDNFGGNVRHSLTIPPAAPFVSPCPQTRPQQELSGGADFRRLEVWVLTDPLPSPWFVWGGKSHWRYLWSLLIRGYSRCLSS